MVIFISIKVIFYQFEIEKKNNINLGMDRNPRVIFLIIITHYEENNMVDLDPHNSSIDC
jgi:hypothetical protein